MKSFDGMRKAFLAMIEENGVGEAPVRVTVRGLTPTEALGTPEDRDYPLIKGRERLLEAEILGSRGQAFTDTPGDFSGTLREAADLPLTDNHNQAIFIAALNGLMRHLGLIENTVHCKDTSPPQCAADLVEYVRKQFGNPRIAMVGFQPRMVQALAQSFELRVTDLDEDNIGQVKFGVTVQGPDRTRENIEWCDMALITGSTTVNDTMDELLSGKPTVFFGITVAGPAALLNLARYCPYSS